MLPSSSPPQHHYAYLENFPLRPVRYLSTDISALYSFGGWSSMRPGVAADSLTPLSLASVSLCVPDHWKTLEGILRGFGGIATYSSSMWRSIILRSFNGIDMDNADEES
ncbi:hypothetical protein BM1_06122 [Bipolaris maydis]|nr:hypothetical protein BM1_06122 [Bipolaris maydis]